MIRQQLLKTVILQEASWRKTTSASAAVRPLSGRTLSLNGSVELENSTVALQTGFLQICKTALGGTSIGGLDGRLFSFHT
ncbi:MAG: hypothetical protein WKF71_13805 [Pyrinomonadaceae bacterium]